MSNPLSSSHSENASGRRTFLAALGAATTAATLPSVARAKFPGRPTPRRQTLRYNIEDFGAVGDGETNNRRAIQEAIDTCSREGGGTVYVPSGEFMTGSIRLKSYVQLFLEQGATVFGSDNPNDYEVRKPTDHVPHDHWGSVLLLAEGQEHVGVSGSGAIRGAGFAEPRSEAEQNPFRPRMLAFEGARHVHVEGVTLQDSDRWTLHLYQCAHVRVRGLGIFAGRTVYNTDGICVDGSANVAISDCDIAVGDDCIVLKTSDYLGPTTPCKNVSVTNCALSTRSTGFKIGTETHDDFENIVFSNSVIYSGQGIRPHDGVALESVDGARIRGVAVTNISMRGVDAPLFIRLGNRGRRQENPSPGLLKDVVIDNVVASGASVTSNITGLPGHPVENVSLSNIRIRTQGGGGEAQATRTIDEKPAAYPQASMFGRLPSYGLFARHVRGLTLRDWDVECENPDARPALYADDVGDFHVDAFHSDPAGTPPSLIRLRNVARASLRGMFPPAGTQTWVHISGAKSDRIVLAPTILRDVQTPVVTDEEVRDETVHLKA